MAPWRQGHGQGGVHGTAGPRTVSLGRWGPRDGLRGGANLGEDPRWEAALASPAWTVLAAGWMTQVLPAGLDVLWQVQPPLPPLSCLSTPGGSRASSFPLRWEGGCNASASRLSPVTFSSPAPEQVRALLRGGPQMAQQHLYRHLPQREIGNLEGRHPHFTSSLSLTSTLPLSQPRRPYFRREDRSLQPHS